MPAWRAAPAMWRSSPHPLPDRPGAGHAEGREAPPGESCAPRRRCAFFAYPGKPSALAPQGCAVTTLATPADDIAGALASLAEAVGAEAEDAPARRRGQDPARCRPAR